LLGYVFFVVVVGTADFVITHHNRQSL